MRNEIFVSHVYGLGPKKRELEELLKAMPADILAPDGSLPRGVLLKCGPCRRYLMIIDAIEFQVQVHDSSVCRYIRDPIVVLGEHCIDYRLKSSKSHLALTYSVFLNSTSSLWS